MPSVIVGAKLEKRIHVRLMLEGFMRGALLEFLFLEAFQICVTRGPFPCAVQCIQSILEE